MVGIIQYVQFFRNSIAESALLVLMEVKQLIAIPCLKPADRVGERTRYTRPNCRASSPELR